ncbi:S-layer homology domain-containing protein [Paenibacillus marchantiophytorum]|nr:S-layer homology domain-containing protein [Paenibacillus marchantiophytorum]
MYKKGMSIILVMLMVMGGMSGIIAPGGKAYALASFAGGTGVQGDPYQIATADQLNEVRNYLVAGKYFKLTADIDLGAYIANGGWVPIGTDNSPFYGIIDGNSHNITGLTINRPSTNSVGLFGHTGAGSSIANLKLENVHITGGQKVGGLVGTNEGTISDSYVTGSVIGTWFAGGLVGYFVGGTISNSYAVGLVSGTIYVGSLAGYIEANASISHSYATGPVSGTQSVGGLVGAGTGAITASSYGWNSIALTQGTANGTTKLNHVLFGIEYSVNGGAYIPITGEFVDGSIDNISVGKGDTITVRVAADVSASKAKTLTVSLTDIKPLAAPTTGILVQGTNFGTTKLTGVTSAMEYKVNTGSYTAIDGTSVDNIAVEEGDEIYVRVKETILQAASAKQLLIADVGNIKPAVQITIAAIAGVTAPVTGATPVVTIADTTEYTASITWSLEDETFADNTVYTATITIKPKAGYTLTGVIQNFFKVAGATTENDANNGFVTAVFPATEAIIATADIAGVTTPVTGATPVSSIAATEYTATIAWSPADAIFAANTAYTATITMTPAAGYTLTGVDTNFFKVAGAAATNTAGSGVINALFPATQALSTAATLTSTIGTVSTDGTANETITNIPYGTTLATLKAAITPAAKASFEVYEADGATIATTLETGKKVLVTAQDGTKVTYTITVNAPAPNHNALLSSLAVDQGTLSPAFSLSNLNYAVGVSNSVSNLTIHVIKGEPNETLTVTGATYRSVTGNVYAYVASNLIVGFNPIQIKVTAQDGTTNNTYILTVDRANTPAPNYSGGGGSATPTDTKVTSTDGKLTLSAGKTGEVSLGNQVTVSIPANATDKELKLTIEKVLDTQKLLANKVVLASPVFEILKNFSENFSNPVTLTFVFDPASLKSYQKASVFYYDEVKKSWVEVGGKVNGNHITVDVNHFTKYAVLAVGQVIDMPVNPIMNFSDISGHWAEANIKQLVSDGIVTGYPDGTFKPNRTVTRAEFAVMLMNTLKLQGEGSALTFTDTANIGDWAKTAVVQAVQAGIINGYEDNTFRPDIEITRAEMAVILAKALGKSIKANAAIGFADDKDVPVWAKDCVAYVKQAGIMQGKGDNQFAPQDHATRAEAVTVLLSIRKSSSSN